MNDNILNEMLDKTVAIIEEHKAQFFQIYQSIKSEIESTQKQLTSLQGQTIQAGNRIDAMMKQEQQAKQDFAKVSAQPNATEDELKASYEAVRKVQNALTFEQDRWKELGQLGDKTEWRLKHLQSRLKQAEELSLVIGSMLHYLSSKIKGFVYSEYYLQVEEKSQIAKIIQAQEQERHRMARELHDGPAIDLEDIIMQLDSNANLDDLKNQLNDCLNEVRQIMFNLRPLALENLGLTAAVKQLVANLGERGILNGTYSVDGKEIKLPKYIETAAFRIIQESLNNVALHSGVKEVKVRLLYSPSALSILIADEGKGFDPDENLKRQEKILNKIDLRSTEHYKVNEIANCYYGVLSMQERAKIIGAELKIISAPGKGTKVHCKIPYKTEDIANAVEAEKIEKAIARATKK